MVRATVTGSEGADLLAEAVGAAPDRRPAAAGMR